MANESMQTLSLSMKALAHEIPDRVNALKRKIALDILKNVVLMTPVDTGRAKGNWLVNIGSAATGVLGTGDDKSDRQLFGHEGGGSLAKGGATINSAKPLSPIYITNNLPYIQALNAGHSKQAPKMFVQMGIRRAIAPLSRAQTFGYRK